MLSIILAPPHNVANLVRSSLGAALLANNHAACQIHRLNLKQSTDIIESILGETEKYCEIASELVPFMALEPNPIKRACMSARVKIAGREMDPTKQGTPWKC